MRKIIGFELLQEYANNANNITYVNKVISNEGILFHQMLFEVKNKCCDRILKALKCNFPPFLEIWLDRPTN